MARGQVKNQSVEESVVGLIRLLLSEQSALKEWHMREIWLLSHVMKELIFMVGFSGKE